MVFEFAQGYNNPVLCGQPVPSTPKDLLIVAGASNSALQYPNGIWHDNLDLTFAHGQAWATMINDIKAKLKSKNLFPDIKIAGGYDSEFYGARFADCRNPTTGRRGPCPDPNSTEDTGHKGTIMYSRKLRSYSSTTLAVVKTVQELGPQARGMVQN
jgi:hypothetical protein